MEFLAVITNTLVVANARLALSDSLQLKNAALIKADKAKSDFLARMSHELRTPMTGVLGIAELLLMSDLNENQQNLTQNLMRSARVLLDLLNDILDFSKIEAQELKIDHTPLRVSTIVDDIGKLFGPLASEKGLRLEIFGPSSTYDGVLGDPKRLRQILVNLVNNAVKFTSHGSITVRVDLQPASDGREIVLQGTVTDTGIGLDTGTLDRLFQPFTQADVSTSRKYGGTGLGLAITKSLVAAMGGAIAVTSTPGHGATFNFSAKLAADPGYVPGSTAERDTSADAAHTLQNFKTARASRILLAEDNETSRFLVTNMLQRMGHSVEAVENGAKAVTAYMNQRHDLVLMDMQMPVMDGPEAMQIIRAGSKTGRRVPIIALTADVLTNNKQSYLEAGADIVMGKPVDWPALAEKIERLVAHRPDPRAAAPGAAAASGTITDQAAASTDHALIDAKMVEELRAILGDTQFEKLQTSFLNSLAEGEQELEAAIAAGDTQRIKRSAHAIKGLTAQYGATRASHLAKCFEAGGADIEDLGQLMTAFKDAVAATQAAVADMRKRRTSAQ